MDGLEDKLSEEQEEVKNRGGNYVSAILRFFFGFPTYTFSAMLYFEYILHDPSSGLWGLALGGSAATLLAVHGYFSPKGYED